MNPAAGSQGRRGSRGSGASAPPRPGTAAAKPGPAPAPAPRPPADPAVPRPPLRPARGSNAPSPPPAGPSRRVRSRSRSRSRHRPPSRGCARGRLTSPRRVPRGPWPAPRGQSPPLSPRGRLLLGHSRSLSRPRGHSSPARPLTAPSRAAPPAPRPASSRGEAQGHARHGPSPAAHAPPAPVPAALPAAPRRGPGALRRLRGDARERQLAEEHAGSPAPRPPPCQSAHDASPKTATPDTAVPPPRRPGDGVAERKPPGAGRGGAGLRQPPREEIRPRTAAPARRRPGRRLRPAAPATPATGAHPAAPRGGRAVQDAGRERAGADGGGSRRGGGAGRRSAGGAPWTPRDSRRARARAS